MYWTSSAKPGMEGVKLLMAVSFVVFNSKPFSNKITPSIAKLQVTSSGICWQ